MRSIENNSNCDDRESTLKGQIMTKRFNKYFPVGDKVVIAHLDDSPGEGGYISIVHAVEPKDMPGEVQIGAYEVPDLVKALSKPPST